MSSTAGKTNGEVGEIKSPETLRFESKSGWAALPGWARMFMRIGSAVAQFDDPNTRIVAAVAVPSRSFAAAFAAVGVVEARLGSAEGASDTSAHMDVLAALEPGSKVVVTAAGTKTDAVFKGIEKVNERRGVRVYFEKDKMSQFVPEAECNRISPGGVGRSRLPKTARQRDKPIVANHRFVESVLGVDANGAFARQDNFSALLVGQVNTFREELEIASFASGYGDDVHTGHLEDLIRTKRFATDVAGHAFRTEVLSDRSRELDPEVAALAPPVVIFDGARSFLKHRTDWTAANWIAVLDKSAPDAIDAAEAINNLYVEKRLEDADPLLHIELEPAVEMTAFKVRRR